MIIDSRLLASLWRRGPMLLALALILAGQPGNAQSIQEKNSLIPAFGQNSPLPAAQVPTANQGSPAPSKEKSDVRIINVKNLKANDLASLISDIFPQDPKNNARSELRFSVDARTNSILVAAPPALMKEIGAIVEKLDVPATIDQTDGQKLMVFPLKGIHGNTVFFRDALATVIDKNSRTKYVVDSSRNLLIVNGDEKTRQLIEALCSKLQTIAETPKPVSTEPTLSPPTPPMQIRLLWLVDSKEDTYGSALSGDASKISPVLAKLGINHPRLMSNGLVNVRAGNFSTSGISTYKNAVILQSSGTCGLVGKNPVLSIKLSVETEKPKGTLSSVETEIQAPFGHYVVLGMTPTYDTTSIFVVQVTEVE